VQWISINLTLLCHLPSARCIICEAENSKKKKNKENKLKGTVVAASLLIRCPSRAHPIALHALL